MSTVVHVVVPTTTDQCGHNVHVHVVVHRGGTTCLPRLASAITLSLGGSMPQVSAHAQGYSIG